MWCVKGGGEKEGAVCRGGGKVVKACKVMEQLFFWECSVWEGGGGEVPGPACHHCLTPCPAPSASLPHSTILPSR